MRRTGASPPLRKTHTHGNATGAASFSTPRSVGIPVHGSEVPVHKPDPTTESEVLAHHPVVRQAHTYNTDSNMQSY
jgi:hypothetical protein